MSNYDHQGPVPRACGNGCDWHDFYIRVRPWEWRIQTYLSSSQAFRAVRCRLEKYDILIVGGGHAGAQAAATLRQMTFEGSMGIIGDEGFFPYHRPPLSKEFLSDEKEFGQCLLRPVSFWKDAHIGMTLGVKVVSVASSDQYVETDQGRRIGYEKLIWAAGGSARQLQCDGARADGVVSIRRRTDVDYIKRRLGNIENVVLIGGGYIGLEATAILTKLKKNVTVLEALDRVLARVAGEPLSRFYESEHRKAGVDLRTNVLVEKIETDGAGHANGVVLSCGETIPADLVIVGTGIDPNIEPIANAGAECDNGIIVDGHCRTSLPNVYAIGDCAAHVNVYADGKRIRLESVQNANDQAKVAARDIMGAGDPYGAVPWFWSNQYDLRLQTVGLSAGHDRCITRGDLAGRSFSVAYLKDGVLIALDAVNAPKEYVQARSHIVARSTLDEAELADSSIALRDVRTAP